MALARLTVVVLGLASCAPDAHPGAHPGARGAEQRPNVLLLVADDQSHDSLSAAGHPLARTPNIDRIAEEGLRFANAFATTSLCAPSRASMLTGAWARRHGVTNNYQALSQRLPTFAELLGQEGYDTAWFGKWHLGDVKGGALPGFQRSAVFAGQGKSHDCVFYVDGVEVRTQGFVDDVATDFALEFLREPRERPFLVGLGFKAPHGPRQTDPRYNRLFRDAVSEPAPNAACLPPFPRTKERLSLGSKYPRVPPGWAEDFGERLPVDGEGGPVGDGGEGDGGSGRDEALRDYLRLVAGLDANVGRVLDALDELELALSTVVVYASDNGYAHGQHGLFGKRTAYEESMRIVLAARGPGIARPGRVALELVLNVDLAPTLLELAGLEPPPSMQGSSLVPLLADRPAAWRRDFVYEYFMPTDIETTTASDFTTPTIIALRETEKKLITYMGYPEWTELYDLEADPFETVNLAGDPASRAELERLGQRLAALDAELGPRPGKRR